MSKDTTDSSNLQQDAENNLIYFTEIPLEEEYLFDPDYYGYLYYLVKDYKIVYIGKTTDLKNRIKNHEKNKIFDSVKYKKISLDFLDEMEKEEILRHLPIYNRQIPKDPFWLSLTELRKIYPGIANNEIVFLRLASDMNIENLNGYYCAPDYMTIIFEMRKIKDGLNDNS